jgi:hypothetical protein
MTYQEISRIQLDEPTENHENNKSSQHTSRMEIEFEYTRICSRGSNYYIWMYIRRENGTKMFGKQGFFSEGQILRQLRVSLTSKDVDPHARSRGKRDMNMSERLWRLSCKRKATEHNQQHLRFWNIRIFTGRKFSYSGPAFPS